MEEQTEEVLWSGKESKKTLSRTTWKYWFQLVFYLKKEELPFVVNWNLNLKTSFPSFLFNLKVKTW